MEESNVQSTFEATSVAETSTLPPTPTTKSNYEVETSKSPAEESVASRIRSSISKSTPIEVADNNIGIIGVPKNLSPQQKNLSNISKIEHKFEQGYDSDGELPSFNMELIKGTQDFDEDAVILTTTATTEQSTKDPSSQSSTTYVHVPISDEEIKKFKNKELRDELKKRDCLTNGKKAELIERLKNALANKKPVVPLEEQKRKSRNEKTNNNNNACDFFSPTAYWDELFPLDEIVDKPANPTFSQPRAPTIEERDAGFVPVKHNFKEVFDRPVFKAKREEIELGRNNTLKLNHDRSIKRHTVSRVEGGVNPTMMDRFQLNTKSTPTDYMEIFLPFEKNRYFSNKKELISISQLRDFTNRKAFLAGAGDSCYQDFRQFTSKEIQQHLGIYMLNGISPAPRIKLKFKPQRDDKVHGNDFVYKSFGPNTERRHKHFKAFFSVQNPLIDPIALTWIGNDNNNKLHLPSKRKRDGSVSDSVSQITIDFSITTGRSGEKRRCARISDDALQPNGGLCI